MLNFDISELVNIDASHMPNALRMSILPCKEMAYSHKYVIILLCRVVKVISVDTDIWGFQQGSCSRV